MNFPWTTSPSYQANLDCSPAKFEEISNLLLTQPQLNSTHLFRADILYDSSGVLLTPAEKEASIYATDTVPTGRDSSAVETVPAAWSSPIAPASVSSLGLKLRRLVIRRLIPRKPKLDPALEQTCFIYKDGTEVEKVKKRILIVYRPHIHGPSEMPWYHPSVKALAFFYCQEESATSIAVHYMPFTPGEAVTAPDRLHRTIISLLLTLCRLAKHDVRTTSQTVQRICEIKKEEDSTVLSMSSLSLAPSSLKDTIIAQHLVQNTYTRLKETYASDLMSRWVESTEPSKHVFEDLAIAAFLIELWKQMYPPRVPFPGFVDLACGNGVLVYILLKEGYTGSGFDARRRKTWEILDIDKSLAEQICIPQPFLDALASTGESILPDTQVHDGMFPPSMFLISNHADELTPWTPLLASLSSPSSPNPFLAIPCCSHALSSAAHRYSANNITHSSVTDPNAEQAQTGDLKALHAAKKADQHNNDKSMYGCLTRKVADLAQEVGCAVELTLMRIPSTRNIGIVGNSGRCSTTPRKQSLTAEAIIDRECAISGGVQAAAKIWIEKAQKLRVGQGRGKVNLRCHEHMTT